MQNSPPPSPCSDLLAVVQRLAQESPRLTDLSGSQLEHLAQAVLLTNLQDELKRLVDLARVSYGTEKELFLANVGRTGSAATRRAYEFALHRVEAWCQRKGLGVLEMKPRDADGFLYDQRLGTRAPASVRLDAAGASSFFNFLERRHDFLVNPFRGSRARPSAIPHRRLAIPTPEELAILVDTADPVLAATLVCLSARGLRVGALPTLVIARGRFSAWSKGRSVSGAFPSVALEAITAAGLNPEKPFAHLTAKGCASRVRYHCRKLARSGRIRETYSAHDFRHFFAVEYYGKTRDLYGLQRLLSHSSLSVTERYLRSIRLE